MVGSWKCWERGINRITIHCTEPLGTHSTPAGEAGKTAELQLSLFSLPNPDPSLISSSVWNLDTMLLVLLRTRGLGENQILLRPAPCSAIIRKFPHAADGDKYRDPQPDIIQRARDLETFSSKWDISIKSLFSGSGNPAEEEAKRM